MNQQRGGTLIGLIIGVLIGLGAALAVAVYVTKVPVPFINKGQSRTPEQDAAEIKKNKDWDPNAPLYGKNPARAASGVVPAGTATAAVGPASAAAAAAAAPAVARPASAAAKAEKPAVSSDPLGDLAKARSSASASVGSGDPFSYFVQAGAFRTNEDAEGQRAKLTLLGVEAKVSEREQSGRTVFRVRVGPFDKKEEAERTKEKLDTAGLETALVRVQR